MTKHILITGASGLIGTHLTEMLLEKGYSVAHLGRSQKEGRVKSYIWNVDKFEIDPEALHGVSTIIHLAGAGVAEKRWTKKRKEEILSSRTESTRLLFEELKKGNHEVTSVIAASAIGYYGFLDPEKIFKEESEPGHDFLATVTRKWEEAVDRINTLNIRVCKIRIGIVLSDKGGALKEMAAPINFFAGAPMGDGEQQLSWIHINDLCAMFIKAVEDDGMRGPYNGTGPYPVSNSALTHAIAQTLRKPIILPTIPAFALKLILGEMADLVLNGSKVSSEKIQRTGFKFKFNDLDEALKDLLQKK